MQDDFEVFADYYCVNETGYWEDDNYVLMRDRDDAMIAVKYHLTVKELNQKIQVCKQVLLKEREKRVRPGLDNKVLASWNGLLCKALAEAYLVFDEPDFKELAMANANYLASNFCLANGKILRTKNAKTQIGGFLDDYAFVIDAFMAIYLVSADEGWLLKAKTLADYALGYFYVEQDATFYYTDSSEEKLVVRKAEWSDNVIPASSSQMAINLHMLSVYFDDSDYLRISKNLLRSVINEIEAYGPGYSNWAILLLQKIKLQTEVVIVGKSVKGNI